MSLTTERALEIVIANQAEQAKAQADQAKAQAEQAKAQKEFQAQQIEAQRLFQATVLAEFGIVKSKLQHIESNVLEIKGRVISDFEGMTASTKSELEECAETIELSDAELQKHAALIARENKTKEAVAYRKHIKSFTTGKVLRTWKPDASHGEVAACGNFVGNVMTKCFGFKFGGAYPESLQTLVKLLVDYYAAERTSVRLY